MTNCTLSQIIPLFIPTQTFTPISPNLAPINAHFDTIGFQTFTHLFPSSTLGFEDVNSLLQTISETNMMRDQLSSLFLHTGTSSNTYQPSYILDATTSSIQNLFMQLISSISNPFINFLVTTAFVLSLILVYRFNNEDITYVCVIFDSKSKVSDPSA